MQKYLTKFAPKRVGLKHWPVNMLNLGKKSSCWVNLRGAVVKFFNNIYLSIQDDYF